MNGVCPVKILLFTICLIFSQHLLVFLYEHGKKLFARVRMWYVTKVSGINEESKASGISVISEENGTNEESKASRISEISEISETNRISEENKKSGASGESEVSEIK